MRAASSGSLAAAASAAAAKAAMEAVSSVPERTSRSWPPPCCTGVSFTARPSSRAPTPTGPPILCPETDMASRPVARKSTGSGAEGLDGVGVDRNAGGVRQLDDPGDGLDGADLVVGPHDGHQGDRRRIAGQLGLQHGQVHDAVAHPPAASTTSAPSCRSSHSTVSSTAWCSTAEHRMRVPRRVLGAAGPVQALDGQVVGLGAAGGEDDLGGMGAGRRGQHFPGVLHGAPGAAARSVQRGRVAGAGQFARQRRQRLRGEGGGGGMIEVDGHRPILPAAARRTPGEPACTFER